MTELSFDTVLVANRGEIAARILRTVKRMGLRGLVLHHAADTAAPALKLADGVIEIEGASAVASFLDAGQIVEKALRAGAQAVHPGYGFLSENAGFCRAVTDAGMVFVGPGPGAIDLMGDKVRARAFVAARGFPVAPSAIEDDDPASFSARARALGVPLLIKPAAGGGGKGMRIVRDLAVLEEELTAAHREGERYFGDRRLYVERYIERPRHIEVQILADHHGTVLHLHERECSLQRRFQKVVEEAPSAALSAMERAEICGVAVGIAAAAGYRNAGTVEFIYGGGSFYFLEMNTRLQVEHAVTEAVTGIDLVAWQLRVAAGARLETLRPSVPAAAHAIEVRLYAEDPAQGFLPQAGRIAAWVPPCAEGVRVDAALCEGLEVSPYYDPMLAKIIASGSDREEARRRLVAALEDLVLFGIASNRRFLIGVLDDPAFVSGDARTNFLEGALPSTTAGSETAGMARALAAALFYFGAERERAGGTWRSGRTLPVTLKLRDSKATIDASLRITGTFAADVMLAGVTQAIEILARSAHAVRFVHNGVTRTARTALDGTTLHLQLGRDEFAFGDATFLAPLEATTAARGSATSPMPGIVAAVPVAVGDEVVRGQTVVVLEAMKMMHEIAAGASGRVTSVLVVPGQQVGMRAPLVEIVSVE